MTQAPQASELLASALHGAADVARARLGRDVAVVEGALPEAPAILRFDLPFSKGGRLTWLIANEDATGFADMLIGGTGDRGAVPTEMHLDALTVAFSDMLQRAVDTVAGGLAEAVEAGEVDLGMETSVPDVEPGGARVVLALDIAGFGPLAIVQQADALLTRFLETNALGGLAPAGAAGGPAALAQAAPPDALQAAADALGEEAPPVSAGPAPVAAGQPVGAAPGGAPDNVVPLQAPPAVATGAPVRARPPQGDLDMLMNVPLPLTVELGSTQRTIRELVDFSIGSIIELGKLAGDPLDIKVNDRVIARGEVVVIDEEFGIRVTEIVSPEDRLLGLG